MTKLFLNDPNISSVVFYPRKSYIPDKVPENVKILKFEIEETITIGGILWIKDVNLPTIIMFHGNGEVAMDYDYFFPAYHDCGVNLAVADFRGYGFSTGKPIYGGLITDAMPIYTQFREFMEENGLKNSLFVKGRSLGSTCAAEIGSHNPKDLKGIIFESGFASVYNMMTRLFRISGPKISPESLKEYSNDTRVAKFKNPTLIIHGTADWIVPYEEGELIYETIPEGVYKKLISIEGAGHNNIFSFQDEYFPPLKEFVEKFK